MSSQVATSVNPSTGETIAEYTFQSSAQLQESLARANAGFRSSAASSMDARAQQLKKMAGVLRARIEPLARMATIEMGKPIAQARAEVQKCAALCDWYAENGSSMPNTEKTTIGDGAYVSYLPLGPILAVMPWNFPYWQVMRGAVPILLSGNSYVLKHAPNVMGCAYALAEAWNEAGLPAGAFTVINVPTELVSEAIVDPRIAAVAVTGSVRAGAAIAAQAGAALKKTVLELGGSDPFIVLADANVDAAVSAAVESRFLNAGQVCIAAKRIILDETIAGDFIAKFVPAVAALTLGDPLDEGTFIGPMARFDLRDDLDKQVQASVNEGAELMLGGRKIPGAGSYYEPTVLWNVRPGMTSFVQETFGPAASLIVAENAENAIELANDSEFGLSCAIWSEDREYARVLARRMDAGGVFVNGSSASDPRIPIGGVKKSGYGRELSHFGVREFMNAQAVWIDRQSAPVATSAKQPKIGKV